MQIQKVAVICGINICKNCKVNTMKSNTLFISSYKLQEENCGKEEHSWSILLFLLRSGVSESGSEMNHAG